MYIYFFLLYWICWLILVVFYDILLIFKSLGDSYWDTNSFSVHEVTVLISIQTCWCFKSLSSWIFYHLSKWLYIFFSFYPQFFFTNITEIFCFTIWNYILAVYTKLSFLLLWLICVTSIHIFFKPYLCIYEIKLASLRANTLLYPSFEALEKWSVFHKEINQS